MGLPSSAGLPVPEAHRSFPGASGSALIPGPAVLARGTRSFCKPLHSGTEFVGTARSVPRLSPAAGSALRCPVIHPAGGAISWYRCSACSSCHFMFSFVFIGHNLLCREGTTGAVVTAKQSRCRDWMLNGDKKTSGVIKEPEQCFQPFRP